MKHKNSWRNDNIDEIRKRTLKYSAINYGKIIVLNKNKEINLLQVVDNKASIIIRNIVNYNDIKNAASMDERIFIVLEATRDFTFYFYFGEEVANLIING